MNRAMEPSFSIGRLFGIQIGFSVSWFIIFALVTWTLAEGYFPAQRLISPDSIVWALALIGSLLFFASVLVHELAHSVVALHNGIPVTRITLFIFGGVAQIGREAPTPRVEAAISAAGPAASFVLAIVFGFAYLVTVEVSRAAASLFMWLALVNGSLAIFNLLPGFPLDGGRLLRALIWSITNDFRSATRVASIAGQAAGLFLAFYGLSLVFGPDGILLQGLWPALIGMFLYNAAQNSWRALKLTEDLKDVTVQNAMVRDVVTVPVDSSVKELVENYLLRQRHRRYPVVEGDRLVGTVGFEEVRSVPIDRRESSSLQPLLRLVEEQPPLEITESGDRALEKMAELGAEELPVVSDGRLVGMLRRDDLLGLVQIREHLRQ
jgi:Zn-dependent protease/predicted transcriptional regulator